MVIGKGAYIILDAYHNLFSFCIKNGVSVTDAEREWRLERNAHPLQYVADDDENTIWISGRGIYLDGGFSVTIDLNNGNYEVIIQMQFIHSFN